MSKDDARRALEEERRELRRLERHMRRDFKGVAPMRLLDYFRKRVTPNLSPGNAGNPSVDSRDIYWDFLYTVTFNFGTNPDFQDLSQLLRQSFKNSMPYAFAITAISRKHWDEQIGDNAGESLPLQIELRSGQSTYQYTNQPVDIHAIGKYGCPTILDYPIVLGPSGQLDVFCSLAPEQQEIVGYNWEGISRHEITFHGVKTHYHSVATRLLERMF